VGIAHTLNCIIEAVTVTAVSYPVAVTVAVTRGIGHHFRIILASHMVPVFTLRETVDK
jgi:hypothetical protein